MGAGPLRPPGGWRPEGGAGETVNSLLGGRGHVHRRKPLSHMGCRLKGGAVGRCGGRLSAVGTTRLQLKRCSAKAVLWGPGTRSAPTNLYNGAESSCVPTEPVCRLTRAGVPGVEDPQAAEGDDDLRVVPAEPCAPSWGLRARSRRREASSRLGGDNSRRSCGSVWRSPLGGGHDAAPAETVFREGCSVGALGLVPHRPSCTTARSSVVFQRNLCGGSPSGTLKVQANKGKRVVGAAGEFRADRTPSSRLSGRLTARGRAW